MSIDGDFFYGDKTAWGKYVGAAKDSDSDSGSNDVSNASLLELATKVIKGEYGNGTARKAALGSRYNEVQAKVNDLYAKANKVIKGAYGNGTARKTALGNEYDIVQYIVNNMLKYP